MSLTIVLLSIVSGLFAYLVIVLRKKQGYWKSLGIPCEEPHFILGNLSGVQTKRGFWQIWEEYYNRFKGTGPFAGFYWFFKPAVFVLDPALVKNILIKDFSNFTDRGFFTMKKMILCRVNYSSWMVPNGEICAINYHLLLPLVK